MKTIIYNSPKNILLVAASLLVWLSLASFKAQAAGVPSATTLSADNTNPTSATIHGRFTANGADTLINIVLSDNGAPAILLGCCTIPAPFVDYVVPMTLTSLDPGHTYTYRFQVSNSYGTNESANLQFTTPTGAPSVTTLAPINITATSARLQAQMKANGESSAYFFEWGTSTNNTVTVRPGFLNQFYDSVEFYDATTLQPNTGYYVRGIANNSQGTTYGDFVYFRTAGPPLVDTLAAQNVGASTATLRGTVAPNGLDTQYSFQLGTSISYGSNLGAGSVSAGQATNSVTFNATGLGHVQTYHYRLVASNALGQTFGSDMVFTTISLAPTIITGNPTNVFSTNATLVGTVITIGEGAGVWFELGKTTNYGTRGSMQIAPATATATAFGSVNVQRGETYHYRFVGSNSYGIVYGQDVAFTTPTANDNCANALVIDSLPFTHTESTADATSTGDPALQCGIVTGGNAVWFKVTLVTGGILTVDTAGSSFDTIQAIYSGDCGALNLLTCGDDAGGGARWSSNQVEVISGTHYILVGGYHGLTGSLQLNVRFIPLTAPTVTATVADVGPRAATLRGNIDPGNLPTMTWWVFGTNGGAGNLFPGQLNSGGQPYTLSTPMADLLPGKTYHYQLVASNRYGVVIGTSQNFTTPADNSLLDVSVPGDVIAASSPNSPADEIAPKAIDNDVTTKYLNFDKLNTSLTVTPSGNGLVRALTLISADDAPERDPSSFVLEGSNDGITFVAFAGGSLPPFIARHSIQSFPLPGTNDFNFYRVWFPSVLVPFLANSVQIAEVELLHHAEITSPSDAVSITLPPGAVDVRGVGSLFDRQLDDIHKLEVAPLAGGSTIVDITPAAGVTVLKGFELIGAADDLLYPERHPSSVTVAGSPDGTHFVTLATVTPGAPASNLQISEYSTETNTTAYVRYRVTFGPPASGDRLQVGEMRLFGEASAVPPTLSIRASGTNVLMSWQNTAGFNLETRSQLNNGSWVTVTVAPVLGVDGINTVTVPRSGATGFFRLRK